MVLMRRAGSERQERETGAVGRVAAAVASALTFYPPRSPSAPDPVTFLKASVRFWGIVLASSQIQVVTPWN